MSAEKVHDPDLYARLVTPRPRSEVEASFAAFVTDLRALREKHGISDLLFMAGAAVEGEASVLALHGHFGDSRLALDLAAALYRTHRQAHEDALDERVGVTRKKRGKKG